MNCPKCGSDHIVRTRREWWMRIFSNSIAVRCCKCMETSLVRDSLPNNARYRQRFSRFNR